MALTSNMSVAFILVLLYSTKQVLSAPGTCVMQGPCLESPTLEDRNCREPRPAAPLKDAGTYLALSKICPHLITKGALSPVCCSPTQVTILTNSLAIPEALLDRCPACFENFKKIFCDLTCSPDQDDFLYVTKTKTEGNNDVIEDISYYVDKTFAEKAFSSCKNVRGLSDETTAMSMMCGGVIDCSAQSWLDFLGLNVDNGGMSPFQINYHLLDGKTSLRNGKQITPLSRETFSCSEPAGSENQRCKCEDCKEPSCV